MRIRLSGEVGGMVIVVIAGVIAASIIDGILFIYIFLLLLVLIKNYFLF